MQNQSLMVPNIINHPVRGVLVRNQQMFWENTRQLEFPLNTETVPAGVVNQRRKFKVPNRGFATHLTLRLRGTVTVGTYSALTAKDAWPYGLIRRCVVKANNVDIINCSGLDLYARRQMVTEHSALSSAGTANTERTAVAGANGTNDIDLMFDIPLASDRHSGVGGIFAESNDTDIEVDLTFAAQDDLFAVSGTTVLTWGAFTIETSLETYVVPPIQTEQGMGHLLPDVSVIHMMHSNDHPFAATGDLRMAVSKTYGNLLRASYYLYNGAAGDIVDPNVFVGPVVLRHGQNMPMREYSPAKLLTYKNAKQYNGPIDPGYQVFDFVSENPIRDAIIPRDLTDLEVVVNVPSGTTVNSGAHGHLFEEVLVQSRTWAMTGPNTA